ncbi:MAG TPA: tyrosine-type recombinase/integrase [Pseudolabrys sp.]|nr:tyrosine-type recombinase/integrase [Pseudolabrys sp.]
MGDVSELTRANIVGGRIKLTQEKTGAEMSIPIHPKLAWSLRRTPANGIGLVNSVGGQRLSRFALYRLIKAAAAAAGLPKCCTPHALRKAMSRRLGESGATNKQIMAITGHKSSEQVDLYTRKADQIRLSDAAINLLTPRTRTEQKRGKPRERLPQNET